MNTPSEEDRSRVLLVSPEANFHRILERILTRCGYAVRVATSGEAAFDEAMDTGFHVVVTQVDLPGPVCGLTLLSRLRERGLEVPVVMLTERDTERLRKILGCTSGTACLSQDVDVDMLKSTLASFVSTPGNRRPFDRSG